MTTRALRRCVLSATHRISEGNDHTVVNVNAVTWRLFFQKSHPNIPKNFQLEWHGVVCNPPCHQKAFLPFNRLPLYTFCFNRYFFVRRGVPILGSGIGTGAGIGAGVMPLPEGRGAGGRTKLWFPIGLLDRGGGCARGDSAGILSGVLSSPPGLTRR